jgi:hypothetical protein
VERSHAQRDEIGSCAARIRGEIGWVATLVRAATALRRSGPVIALVAGVVMIAGPSRVLRALGAAVRYVPIALDAYRVVRGDRIVPGAEPGP